MEWIDKNIQLPYIGEFDDLSIPVIVTDGKLIGFGMYKYDVKEWVYNMPGYNEKDDNNITHWMLFPEFPKK